MIILLTARGTVTPTKRTSWGRAAISICPSSDPWAAASGQPRHMAPPEHLRGQSNNLYIPGNLLPKLVSNPNGFTSLVNMTSHGGDCERRHTCKNITAYTLISVWHVGKPDRQCAAF